MKRRRHLAAAFMFVAACSPAPGSPTPVPGSTAVDTIAISAMARELSADSMRGRGPWTRENELAARLLASELERLGAQPVFGDNLLVPFAVESHPRDTVFNVVGLLPGREGRVSGELIGITAHLDHLGVGVPDASGDSIYNGFLDAALPMAMILDAARRYSLDPGDRPLVVMFFNLEEQGLLGSSALVERPDAAPFISRLRLVIGVDAGSPAGEAVEWQLMGALPGHAGARLADSLASERGWTTTPAAPRPISDVYMFARHGVPILFPIPGSRWKGYTDDQRASAMERFDHYHQPSDEWRDDFPLAGTASFADWLGAIVRGASSSIAPPRVIGEFVDDYGSRYSITASEWRQHPGALYHIMKWNVNGKYLIARNDSANADDPGRWTRIDWLPLTGMPPYTWGYCYSIYDAPTAAAAESVTVARRATPRTGCNGFPFSRMKPVGSERQ